MTPPAAVPLAAVTPQSDMAKSTSVVPLPEHNPQTPTLLATPPPAAPAPAASPPPQVVTDMPPPDANPNRTAALPFAMKGTLTPAIAAPPPAMDYTAILKPILSYDLSDSDEANIREVLRSGTAAAARIKDPAARDFALWYKYRNSPAISGNAEDIEQFRLAHPDWPAQDELREKAETVLFLTDASPDEVRAFFKNSAPLTGAGKAALAGVNMKDGDEAGAKALVVSAWRDHQLNAAVEKKILDRYGNMLSAEHASRAHRQAALSGRSGRHRGGAARVQAAARRRAEEDRGAHRRGQTRRQCRQAAQCTAGERGRSRCRPALQPYPMAASHQGQGPPRSRPGRCCSMRRASRTSCSTSTIGGRSGASIAAAH